MAQIIIDIPDIDLARVLTAVCSVKGYNASSGLTQAQFAKQWAASQIKDIVRFYEREQAKNTAFSAVVDVNST